MVYLCSPPYFTYWPYISIPHGWIYMCIFCQKGKDDPIKIFSWGMFFVEHASSTIIIYNQVSLGASYTVRSKELYVLWAAEHRLSAKSYRGDNGVYKLEVFKKNLALRQQNISYSGVGVHVKNRVIEGSIQKLVTSARTMMLHQALL